MINKIRIDKFLWCIRIFKTRKESNNACTRSKILVNEIKIKPSYLVKIDDTIRIKQKLITLTIKVKRLLDKRVGAKFVDSYIEDITEESEKIKMKISRSLPHSHRERGKGRPTKKERRDIMKELDGLKKY